MLPSANPSPPVITYGNVQDADVDGIRDMLLDGRLKPGGRLPQVELAKTFGVSTMPLREALRQLQAEGLAVFCPRRGATVASVSAPEYEEICLIREALEALACLWAAEDWDLSQQYRLYFYSLPGLGPHQLANYHRIYQTCHDRDPQALLNAFRVIWGERDHMLIQLVREEESKKQTT